jgi:hypothetical protein
MDLNEMTSFCGSPWLGGVTQRVVPAFVDLSASQVEEVYAHLRDAYVEQETAPPILRPVHILRFGVRPGARYHGSDLPCWWHAPGKPVVMVLALDALRSPYNDERIDREMVSLSTPFTLHDTPTRVQKRTGYWRFIEALISECSVYVTDLYKVYFKDAGGRASHALGDYTAHPLHARALALELELVRPDVVITMGNVAASGFRSLGLHGPRHIALPHLSNAANGAKKKFMARHGGMGPLATFPEWAATFALASASITR